MDGVLIIDKPAGLTSHDVVNRVRRVLKTRRIGHTGTLDPFATGVLVLLIGRATRLAQYLDRDEKEYEALVRFGFETDTGDHTGQRKAGFDLSEAAIKRALNAVNWDELLSRFRGEIWQVPPMHSAKKIAGKRLYSLARQGKVVERKAVPVTIRRLEISNTACDSDTMRLLVSCSAGTYIRTLAEDIGRAVGTGAHLEGLLRTRSGRFSLESAVSVNTLENMPFPESGLISMADALAGLPEVTLSDDRLEKTRQGLASRIAGAPFPDGAAVKMVDGQGGLAAVGIYSAEEKSVRPKVVLV